MDKIKDLTNDILVQFLEDKAKERSSFKNLAIVMAITMFLQTALLGGGILYIFNNFEATTETTTTTTTDQKIEGENAEINNVKGNQYKDNSTHNEGGNK